MESSYFKHKSRSRKVWTIIGWGILGIIGVTVFALLFGYAVMWLWNWLMPELFGLKEIIFWQAVGIILLAKLLFGGFGNHGKHHKSRKKSCDTEIKHKEMKHGFSKWKYYDRFWKEEGESAYQAFIEKKEGESKIESKIEQNEV
jgi:hypothetical protein